MGRMSDMHIDMQNEAADELLCEIDHYRERLRKVERRLALADDACRKLVAWDDGEKAGPDYGTLTRNTHPQGELIWREWWDRQLDICRASFDAARAFLEQKK